MQQVVILFARNQPPPHPPCSERCGCGTGSDVSVGGGGGGGAGEEGGAKESMGAPRSFLGAGLTALLGAAPGLP